MVEEEKEKSPAQNILDEIKEEREALDKSKDEAQKVANELRELEARRLLSGTSSGAPQEEIEKEERFRD